MHKFLMQLFFHFSHFSSVTYLGHLESLHADIFSSAGKGPQPLDTVESDEPSLSKVLAAFESRNYSVFKTEYQIASSKQSLPAADVFWCRLLAEAGDLPQAIQTLEMYQQSFPDDPEAYIAFGFIAMKSGRWTDARLQLQFAERLIQGGKLPSERLPAVLPGLIQFLAEVALQKQQWDLAQKEFGRLQELQPGDSLPTWRIGLTKAMAGQLEEGIATMKEARNSKSELPCPHLTVAMTLMQQKPWFTDATAASLVENEFRKSILAERENPTAWREYMKWLLMLDRNEDVIRFLDKAPEAIKATRDTKLLHSIALHYKRDFVGAGRLLEELLTAYPEDLEISDQLVLVLLENEEPEKRLRAKLLAKANLERFPDIENTIATAGWTALSFGELENADQLLSKLISRGSFSAQSAFFLGRFFERHGRRNDAKAVLELSIKTVGIFPERTIVKRQLSEWHSLQEASDAESGTITSPPGP